MSGRGRVEAVLESPRAPLWAVAAAVLLSLPSLALGELLDDHLMRAQARAGVPAWDRYAFAPAGQMAALRERGAFGWWSADELSVSFFRPLSAVTHALDYALWPDLVWLMHLENVLIYALLTWLVARVVQRVHGPELVAGTRETRVCSGPTSTSHPTTARRSPCPQVRSMSAKPRSGRRWRAKATHESYPCETGIPSCFEPTMMGGNSIPSSSPTKRSASVGGC